MRTKYLKKIIPAALLSIPFSSTAGNLLQGETVFSNPTFNIMLGLIIFLLLIIYGLTRALAGLSRSDIWLKDKKEEENNSGLKNLGILLFLFLTVSANAEVAPVDHSNDWKIGGLDVSVFYFMFSIILLEGIVITLLLHTIKYLVRTEKSSAIKVEKKEKNILEILNASVEIEREAEIMMDHEYDGIRELDNDLPPWWRYGFYLTVFVSVIYLIHYHIAGTGELQLTEYNNEVAKGKAEVEAYMKEAASNVDETTVKMMGAADIESGKAVFLGSCATCHGKLGEGGVGPNLTDNYWLHNGSLSGIFKTIKYGWPDKGMKSWKEDFSPTQIAQLSSYLVTLLGTNPPKPKAPQGELFIDKGAVPDSIAPKIDSLKASIRTDSTLTADAAGK